MIYRDILQDNIVRKLKNAVGNNIIISDNIHKFEKKNKSTVLFNGYNENPLEIRVISYSDYDMYGIEKIPDLEESDIVGLEIQDSITGNKATVTAYDAKVGVLVLDNAINGLIINVSELSTTDTQNATSDIVVVNGRNGFNKTLNASTVLNYRRFDLIYYVYNDLNGAKSNHFMDLMSKEFNRDFFLIDNIGNKTKTCVYITEQLRFELLQANTDNKVIKGTMFLQTYNN